jgi:hypothetical protein
MQLHEFYAAVTKRQQERKSERLGQAAYNLLCEVRQDLAEKVAGTDDDPYYVNSNWRNFNKFLAANW